MVLRQRAYWVTVYRRTWKGSVFTSFVLPLFYVVAMGVLLGGTSTPATPSLGAPRRTSPSSRPGLARRARDADRDRRDHVAGHGHDQVGPHLLRDDRLAAARWPTSSPAQLLFVMFRVATDLRGVPARAGAVRRLRVLVRACCSPGRRVLVGLSFAGLFHAFSATHQDRGAASRSSTGCCVVPMFLFSGAFFPITNLPPSLEWLARLTPLWHGVDLTRMLAARHGAGRARARAPRLPGRARASSAGCWPCAASTSGWRSEAPWQS